MDNYINMGRTSSVSSEPSSKNELSLDSLRRKPFIRWSISIAVVFFLWMFSYGDEPLTGAQLSGILALVFFAAFMMVGLWTRSRISHFAFRICAAMIFVAFLWYFVYEAFFSETPFRLSESRGEASPRNALLGLVLIGLPCLLYALRSKKSHDHETIVRERHRHDVH